MRKSKLLPCILAALTACTLLTACQSEPESLTPEQKQSDFDTLTTILDEAYPFWQDVAAAGIDKDEIYERYASQIQQTETDYDYLETLVLFLNEFQGLGHLSGFGGASYKMYLDLMTPFLDDEATRDNAMVQYALSVLNDPKSTALYGPLDPDYWGFQKKKLGAPGMEPQEVSEVQSLLETDILDDGTAYMKIPSFATAYYYTDAEAVAAFFDEIGDTENLIIDIRGNGGGNSFYWYDLIVTPNAKTYLQSDSYYLYKMNDYTYDYSVNVCGRTLQDISQLPEGFDPLDFTHFTVTRQYVPAAEDPYPGDIWLLVDENNYSAAEEFAVFAKNSGFATLVGTSRTGGDSPACTPMLLTLPESGFIFRMSTFYGLNPDGTSNERYGTAPDILVKPTEDPLEAVLQKIAERS